MRAYTYIYAYIYIYIYTYENTWQCDHIISKYIEIYQNHITRNITKIYCDRPASSLDPFPTTNRTIHTRHSSASGLSFTSRDNSFFWCCMPPMECEKLLQAVLQCCTKSLDTFWMPITSGPEPFIYRIPLSNWYQMTPAPVLHPWHGPAFKEFHKHWMFKLRCTTRRHHCLQSWATIWDLGMGQN